MRVRRALLFMPGDDRRKIEKGAALGVDAVIMDLEDGVALNRKAAARETIRAALREVDFGKTERLVRINPVGSVFHHRRSCRTIDATSRRLRAAQSRIGGGAARARRLAERRRAERGWTASGIALLAIVETALGVVNLREIAASSPRLQALIFGAEDLAGDMGAVRTPDGWEGFYARSAVVLHAKAYGLQAIDTPFVHLRRRERADRRDRAGALHGLHRQAGDPPEAGRADPADVHAERRGNRAGAGVDRRARAHQAAAGRACFSFEGKMIDMPMIRAAEAVIARARAAGLIEDELRT